MLWCADELLIYKMLNLNQMLPVLSNFFICFCPSCPTDKMRAFDDSCIGVYQLQRIKITSIAFTHRLKIVMVKGLSTQPILRTLLWRTDMYATVFVRFSALAELTSWRFSSASSAAFSSWRAAIRERLFWCKEWYTWLRWLRQRDCSTNRVELSLKNKNKSYNWV